MRDSSVRLLLLVLLTLALASSAAAQGNTTSNETAVGNETATGNETSGNQTATNETPSEPAGPITIELEGHQDGSATYFTLKGQTAKNPTITVQPGQKVTFVFTAVAGFHNLNVNNGEVKTKIIGDGDSETIEWTAPATEGKVDYWCDPHKGNAMRGIIQVGAAGGGETGGEEGGAITGDTVDLGQYDPACAGKVAPASAAEGETGGPTIPDYVKACQGGDTTTQTREKSGADYVIPASWGLIALGVVGVVWVHKYYKP